MNLSCVLLLLLQKIFLEKGMKETFTDYAERIRDLASIVVTLAEPYRARSRELSSELDFISGYVQDKLSCNQPELMIFGLYNAGKSSIINELVGRDVAAVGDIPVTRQVTYYDFHGYRIADTPGVGAPVEHEQVTMEHLKKADVVLFVMDDSGSHELVGNYERIREIHRCGKKIIIVLNDKEGRLDPEDPEHVIEKIRFKIGENLNRLGLENKFRIIAVNALTARTARLKNNPALYALSNMQELADVISAELTASDRVQKWRAVAAQLIEECGTVLEELDKIEQSSLSDRKIKNFLELVRRQEGCLRNDLNTFIERRMNMLAGTLPATVWSMRKDQPAVEDTIKRLVSENIGQIQDRLLELMRQMKDILDENSTELKVRLQEISEEYSRLDNVSYEEDWNELVRLIDRTEADEQFASGLEGGARSTFRSGLLISRILPEIGITNPYIRAAAAAIDVIAAISGRSLELGPTAEEVAREENRREQARLKAEIQARRDLEYKCRYLCMNLGDQIKSAASECVSEASKRVAEPFRDLAVQVQSDSGRLINCTDNVKKVIFNLEDLNEQLKMKNFGPQ